MVEEQSAEEVLAELDALIAAAGPDADPELVATADALRVSLSRDDEDDGGISGAKRKRADDDRDEDRDEDAAVRRAPDGNRMHPRNAFRDANPDFGALAARQPALKPHLIPRGGRGAARAALGRPRWVLQFDQQFKAARFVCRRGGVSVLSRVSDLERRVRDRGPFEGHAASERLP